MHKAENVVEREKRITKLVGQAETNRILDLREQMGIIPWEGPKLTEDQRQELFEQIILDPIAVQEIVDRERKIWHLSPDRNPKRLRREVQRRYKLAIERGVIGQPAADFEPPEGAEVPPPETELVPRPEPDVDGGGLDDVV